MTLAGGAQPDRGSGEHRTDFLAGGAQPNRGSGEHRTDLFTQRELERYSRQLLMPEWTGAAQERLKQASAVVVGAGALGSFAGGVGYDLTGSYEAVVLGFVACALVSAAASFAAVPPHLSRATNAVR